MIVYRSLDQIAEPVGKAVVTVGNFDGVHLGHREMFRRLKASAAEIGGVSVVVTFDPHPLRVVPSGKPIKLINTVEEKVTLISASGLDYLVIIPFDKKFAELSAEEFVNNILISGIGMKRLIIGYDYAFGKGRSGNAELLRRLSAQFAFDLQILEPVSTETFIYSSTLIRSMILDGMVAETVKYLGRHFSLEGKVVAGAGRGRKLGFPTANIETVKELIPAEGVYAVKVKLDDRYFDGACNIGSNPTFGASDRSIEVYIFDFDQNIYNRSLRVYFIQRIRSVHKFDTHDELVEAIAKDIASCRSILANSPLVDYRDYLEGM